jgi:hypothetical protein
MMPGCSLCIGIAPLTICITPENLKVKYKSKKQLIVLKRSEIKLLAILYPFTPPGADLSLARQSLTTSQPIRRSNYAYSMIVRLMTLDY